MTPLRSCLAAGRSRHDRGCLLVVLWKCGRRWSSLAWRSRLERLQCGAGIYTLAYIDSIPPLLLCTATWHSSWQHQVECSSGKPSELQTKPAHLLESPFLPSLVLKSDQFAVKLNEHLAMKRTQNHVSILLIWGASCRKHTKRDMAQF